MNEPIVKTCDIKVHLGIDVPAYQTINMKVPVSLLEEGQEEALRKEVAMHLCLLDENGELEGSWDEEWESSNQLRVISITDDPGVKMRAGIPVRGPFPIEPNYWEIAQGVIDMVRRLQEGWQEPTLGELKQILEAWGVKL